MIELVDVSKSFPLPGGRPDKVVARHVSARFPSGRAVALLGRNGAGKSSLLQMIAGLMDPDRGYIKTTGSVSWPVGFAGSFHPDLTGAQNARFVARAHGVCTDEFVDFVADFADLGAHFHHPFRSYSAGMRSRLAFGVSMGVRFDTYLVDEVTSVGDADFRRKSESLLRARLDKAGAIVVSHATPLLARLCQSGAVLVDGHLSLFDTVEEAIEYYNWSLRDDATATGT